MRKLIACGVGLVAALALTVPGAFGGAEQTPGVTAKSITIGGTFPLTGPAATYAPIPLGMKAYFSYINARQGPGRQARRQRPSDHLEVLRRRLQPREHGQLTRRLVEQDKVFATVGQLGTEPVLAVTGVHEPAARCRRRSSRPAPPTGARQYKEYPWTIGWQPDYIAEGRLYGSHIKANYRGKKIAIVYQNDDYGKDYLYGFRAALGKAYADANVVAQRAGRDDGDVVAAQMVADPGEWRAGPRDPPAPDADRSDDRDGEGARVSTPSRST